MLVLAGLLGGCRATQPDFDRVDVLATEARELSSSGDFGGAVERWNRIRQIDPARGPESHLELARALLALQREEEALAALEFGIEYFPVDPDLRWARGRLLTQMGFRHAAETDLVLVCDARPDDALAWCELAHLRAELGMSQLAAETFDRALALDNCPAQAEIEAARVHVLAERYERAHELFERAITRAPEDHKLLAEAAHAARLWLVVEQTEPDQLAQLAPMTSAIDWSRRACRLEPQDASAETTLGVLLEATGDLEGALLSYHRAVEVDNFDIEAVIRLARANAALGNTSTASELYERALALPVTPDQAELLRAERDRLAAPPPGDATDPENGAGADAAAEGAAPLVPELEGTVPVELTPATEAGSSSTPLLEPAIVAVHRVGPSLDP